MELKPREALLLDHADRLKSAELLAVCLGTGGPGCSALQLAGRLLDSFGSLAGVLYASPRHLLAQPGLGEAKTAAIKAVAALGARAAQEGLAHTEIFTGNDQVQRFLRLRLAGFEREVFGCLLLDARHRLICFEVLFLGTIDSANVHPREVVKFCMERNAAAVILAHNHPSGVAEPSAADIALTERLQPLLREVGVQLLDHIVVARGGEVSMAAQGLFGSGTR